MKDPVCHAKNCGHYASMHNGSIGCAGKVADAYGAITLPCPCEKMPDDVNKPRKRPALLTPKSRHVLEARGYTVARVEATIPHCFIKQDMFGFADLLAIKPYCQVSKWNPSNEESPLTLAVIEQGIKAIANPESYFPGIVAVQVCAGSGHAAHKTKILAEPRSKVWLQAGGRILLQSWAIQGAKGRRKRYELREEEVTLQMFEEAK